MFPTFQLGSISINTSGLLLFFSIWVGLTRAEDIGVKSGFSPVRIFNLCLFSIAGGLLGARLFFAARYPSAFAADPGSFISPNPLMLDLYGGLLGALIGFLVYLRKHHLPFLKSLDALTPFLLVSAIGLALAHLASGSAYGSPTDLPWGIFLWGSPRNPTQILEALLAALSTFLLWPGNRRISLPFLEIPGVRFLTFFTFAALSRLLIEPLRGESVLLLGPFRMPQLAAFSILLLSLALAASLVRQYSGIEGKRESGL